jgi:riboflavin transporter FmnP
MVITINLLLIANISEPVSLANTTLEKKFSSPTREITAIALFTAVAIVLSRVSFPAPYAGFLFYDVWEIPLVVALIMFGLRAAVAVSVLNFFILLIVNPGLLISGPLYNLVAVLTMFAGIIGGYKLSIRSFSSFPQMLTICTVAGIVARTVSLVIFNSIFLPMSPPLGFGVSATPFLGVISVFNITIALYTIPISFGIVRAIRGRYRYPLSYPLVKH